MVKPPARQAEAGIGAALFVSPDGLLYVSVMPTWDATEYLRFADERTQACRDLAARVGIAKPCRIIDLGCGPGNSTAVLAERWPEAEIIGLDNSQPMIEAARRDFPSVRWIVADIPTWTSDREGPFDLVLSNAALQWVDDHANVFPRLLTQVAPGGALAVQMPSNFDGPAHRAMRELANSARWKGRFQRNVREWHVHDVPFYYEALAPNAARIDLWETEYIHVMSGAEAVVQWYKGTGLRPFLEALASDDDRSRFTDDYLREMRGIYPARRDGRVLFPFRRLFVIAYRSR